MQKTVPLRRRREGKTNYKKRLALLQSGKPRLVVRKSNRYYLAQLINYAPDGDHVLFTVTTKHLKQYGWPYAFRNAPAAYLLGYLAGKKALAQGVEEAILDLGLLTPRPGINAYALLKGAVDAGLTIPHDESIYPAEERIQGKHIAAYYQQNKKNFSYKELDEAALASSIEKVKSMIENGIKN